MAQRIGRGDQVAAAGGSFLEEEGARRLTQERYDQALVSKTHLLRNGEILKGPSDLDNIEYVYGRAIVSPGPGMAFDPNAPNHVGIQFIDLEDRKTSTSGTLEQIRKRVKDVPGAKITVAAQEEGPPTGAPINIEIAGDHFQVLGRMTQKIRDILEKIPFVQDIRDDFIAGSPTVEVRIDRQKAALRKVIKGSLSPCRKNLL